MGGRRGGIRLKISHRKGLKNLQSKAMLPYESKPQKLDPVRDQKISLIPE